MTLNKWLLVAPLAGALGVGAGIGADRFLGAGEAKQDLKPAVSLPITRVVLFNSGVGYFSRSGEVTDDARVDLSFPEADVNDLLKSMVLEDFGGGRVAAVSYDSREPITRTLASFKVPVTGTDAVFACRDFVFIHSETGAASSLAHLKSCIFKDLVQAFSSCLRSHLL